ncbi:hypothetical protein DFH94DRAFT_758427 [Russula ochroleuca]|uniref:FHA domain-containing protein n=1 Tax=Russula ochroleuca TaxID=152965 RepID=A0A9P5MRS8_9AGAM|nr:hypothetical protein DFH94DRAFT_758427 [Russula ochroleuca]
MWVITGPFDGEVSNEVGFQKSKLLKSGKSYLIGRKSTCDLVVNHKKVSHDHGRFEVGGFSPDDVTNVNYTPTLRILNSKNKTMRIWREGVVNGIIVNPSATESLQHNDKVDIVSGLPLLVQWQTICCFETPGKVRFPIPIDGCASLGIHVVRTLHADVTHHLVPSYALTPAHMTSLLSAAQLVKPEWLSELLALSILDPRESTRALEHTFALPPESKFRPGFAAALPTTFKTFKTWEPNEARLNMLKGYRFVFVGEKGLEIPAGYRDLVKRGGAEYEAFTLSAGVVRLRKALQRAKSLAEEKNGKVSPVADVDAMESTVGAEEWKEIVSVAKSLDLEFIQPENILQAVASVDTFFVDSANSQGSASRETPLPDVVPNTLSDEPSIPPPIHPPRATSPEPSTSERPLPPVTSRSEPPAPEPETAEVPIPRRLPPRRAMDRNRTAPSPGPGDDGAIVGPSPSPAPPPTLSLGDVAPTATQLPTPVSQTRKLPPRRRANQGIDASSALASSSSSNPQASHSHFSQLDKYKALFDASNPDRAPASGEIESGTGASGTLSSVPEEEQQESRVQSGDLRGTKRSRGTESGDDVDVEMADSTADVAGVGTGTGTLEVMHRAKRRALDANSAAPPTGAPAPVPAPQPGSAQTQGQGKGPASAAAGAKLTTKGPLSKLSSSNKLDTDENFLTAVNSTKRGKKHEDDFDREFNQLRITKPRNVNTIGSSTALAAATKGIPEAVVAPWDAIDDFGDVGIRGNFMVVVEMDIQRGSAKPALAARTNDAAHPEWMGRPNFKKFKTKRTAALERRQTIELVPSEENDYGIGSAYWRGAASGSQSHSDIHDITAAHPPEALLYSKSKSKSKPKPKPLSKASRASANSRGGRARVPPEDDDEDEGVAEGLDLEADEMEIDVPVPPHKPISTRSKTGGRANAKAPTAAKPPSKAKASPNTKAAAAKGKGKAPARTKKALVARGTTKRRNPALFLSDDEEDELDEIEDEDEVADQVDQDASEAVVALELGADVSEENARGTGTGTFGHASAAGDDERVVDAPGMSATLRSTAGTQLRREAVRAAAKRRAAALVGADDDDSDDDAAVFKGFGARKRGRR